MAAVCNLIKSIPLFLYIQFSVGYYLTEPMRLPESIPSDIKWPVDLDETEERGLLQYFGLTASDYDNYLVKSQAVSSKSPQDNTRPFGDDASYPPPVQKKIPQFDAAPNSPNEKIRPSFNDAAYPQAEVRPAFNGDASHTSSEQKNKQPSFDDAAATYYTDDASYTPAGQKRKHPSFDDAANHSPNEEIQAIASNDKCTSGVEPKSQLNYVKQQIPEENEKYDYGPPIPVSHYKYTPAAQPNDYEPFIETQHSHSHDKNVPTLQPDAYTLQQRHWVRFN